MADNKDKKVLKSSIEREQSQTCLNSAEREKIKGSTNLNVPHLRFPEFSGEWEKHTIGELAIKVGSGVTPKGGETVYKKEGHPFVRSQNVGLGVLLLEDIAYIDDTTHIRQKNTELQIDDVLLNITGASIGRSAVVNEQIAGGNVNQHVCIIRTKDNLVSSFLCNFLLSNYGQKQIDSFQAGGNRQGLNFEQIKSIKIGIPCLKEQSKIAKTLQLLDERIATQNKIIEKLESLIKGIIYQTKSIGLAHNTWQKTELKNVLQERNEKNANGYDVCSVSVTQGVVNQIEYLGRSFAAKDTLHYNVVKYGDIVYTKSPTGDFPYGIVKRSNIKCDVAVSPLYGVYKPVNDYVGIILHFYFMQSNNAINYLHPLIQKGAKNTINITNGRFLENTIPLPKKEEETKCLAWVLTSIQNKIILEQDLLHSYQKQKQYLLRQMFI